jgi:Mg-chelatase subunit ChlD
MDICKHAARTIAAASGPNDRLSLVTFSTDAVVCLQPTIMDEAGKKEFEAAISQVHPSNATNLQGGIHTSLEVLKGSYSGRNAVVCLLTDGVPTQRFQPPRGYQDRSQSGTRDSGYLGHCPVDKGGGHP